jgi:hypothetical protein
MYYQDYRLTKRLSYSNKKQSGVVDPSTVEGFGFQQFESVMSFRDDNSSSSAGKPVASASVDPYAYFLDAVKRQRGGSDVVDNGHAFYKVNHWIDVEQFAGLYRPSGSSSASSLRYGGPITPSVGWRLPSGLLFPHKAVAISADGAPVYSNPSNSTVTSFPALATDGSQAIAQEYFTESVQNAPAWSGLTSLSELREGLPRIPGFFLNQANPLKSELASARKDFSKRIWAKRAGSEATNVNFGWVPLVGDAIAFAKALAWIDYELQSLQRNSGRPVRRRRGTPLQSEVRDFSNLTLNGGGAMSAMPSTLFRASTALNASTAHSVAVGSNPTARLKQTESTRDWYSASFSYRYTGPKLPDFSEKVRYLLRPDLTIGQLYNAAPWSWLVDWYFHLSTTLESNQLIADTNLIQNYGYCMTERFRRSTLTVNPGSYGSTPNWQPPIPELSITFGTTEKRRVRGNPFGFNVRLDNLSIRQLGILGGLGLAKL